MANSTAFLVPRLRLENFNHGNDGVESYQTTAGSNNNQQQHQSGAAAAPSTTKVNGNGIHAGEVDKEQQQQQQMQMVEFIVSAKDLANLDKFSKSDPICVLERRLPFDSIETRKNGMRKKSFGANGGSAPVWCEIGRTEVIMNNLEPKWNTKIQMNLAAEQQQQTDMELLFSCYDIDSNKQSLAHHDFLGQCQCQLARILQAPNGTLTMRLLRKDNRAYTKGELRVHAELLPRWPTSVTAAAEPAVHFEIRGLFSSPAQKQHHAIVGNAGATVINKPTAPSVYLEFYRIVVVGVDNQQAVDQQNITPTQPHADNDLMVYRTERVKHTWYPEWAKFQVPLRLLVGQNGDRKTNFLIRCYDKEASGSHKLIGSIQTSVYALTTGHQWRVELEGDGGANNVQAATKQQQNTMTATATTTTTERRRNTKMTRSKSNPQQLTSQHHHHLDPIHKKHGHLHFIHVSVS